MNTEIDPKILEKLSLMLYPESLEQYSKVISILNSDCIFKGEDLYSLKDISKLFPSKEILYKYLTHISKQESPFLSVNEDCSKCQILIDDKLIYYRFINIPPDYNIDSVKVFLSLKDNDFLRLYKSSLFWILISINQEFNEKFGKFLETLTIDKDNTKIKFNVTSAAMIKNMIKKETEKKLEKKDIKKNSPKKYEEFNRSKKCEETMSWRKKSEDNDEEEIGYGYKKNFGNKRRTRFQSDPTNYQKNDYYYGKKNYYNDNYYKKDVDFDELKVKLNDVKYPIFIKEKYTNNEILDYLDTIKKDIIFNEDNFVNFIEDIIDKDNMKQLEIENKKSIEVPKNNPLLNFKMEK